MKKLSKIELKDAAKLLPTQMRDITGGIKFGQSGSPAPGGALLFGYSYGGGGTPRPSQCCLGEMCEDYPCTTNQHCEAAYAPGAVCKNTTNK